MQSIINWSLGVVLCCFFLMDVVMVGPFREMMSNKHDAEKNVCFLDLYLIFMVCKRSWSC